MSNLKDRISIRTLRTCRAMEGEAFSLTLCIDGKPAAHVNNEGCGGPTTWRWIGSSAAFNSEKPEGGPAEPLTMAGQVWHDYVASLPPWDCNGKMRATCDDIALDEWINQQAEEKRIVRWSKKNVVFRLPNDEEGTYRLIGRRDRGVLSEADRVGLVEALRVKHKGQAVIVR